MASLLSPRRTEHDIVLRAAAPVEAAGDAGPLAAAVPRPGWALAAVAAGLLCAGTGWLLVAGLSVLGWVAAEPGTLGGALATGTRVWLAGHGVGVELGTAQLTLVPWGLPALLALLLSRCAGFAVRAARPHQQPRARLVAPVLLAAYLTPVLAAGFGLGRPGLAPGHLLVVIAVLAAAALSGAVRARGLDPTRSWPGWARPLPRAVLAAQLVLLAAGAAVLVTGLVRNLDRVTALQAALGPGVTGGIALLAAQLAYAPNAFVWAASYALGAGFTLGNGSVVAPAATDLGVLPGLPLLGALPGEGPGPAAALWWLVAGVLAGALAAWLAVRPRPAARFDESSLVGALAGVLGGLVFVGLAWASSGDLGSLRLARLGPLLLPLLVMSVTTLGLAGMATGLVLGSVPRTRRERPADEKAEASQPDAAGSDDEPTQVLSRDTDGAAATEVLPGPSPTAPAEDPRPPR